MTKIKNGNLVFRLREVFLYGKYHVPDFGFGDSNIVRIHRGYFGQENGCRLRVMECTGVGGVRGKEVYYRKFDL